MAALAERLGLDGFVPVADARENVRGHMQSVRRSLPASMKEESFLKVSSSRRLAKIQQLGDSGADVLP
ncbi:hypothetical protein GGD65_006189 [Bradyrhizobium sp. CIR18]|uniref:hypothetical protein n=1 Tax=unclassified Bradyrhizobium TaxID=2631580 RepID=UPI0017F7B70D|nr:MULTISPECIES: hypothetical protein [unclassified Bradyrhizobium]MBB4365125.1 hypothetical protein [Bradyrhizobium sp. CIR18]MBB4379867.1 hypothetical protein [Bradyrhizobium sp. SBR1B]